MLHEYLSAFQPWIDRLIFLCAGVAALSLSQAALAVSIGAGLVSIILGAMRLHDRIKYGPARGRE